MLKLLRLLSGEIGLRAPAEVSPAALFWLHPIWDAAWGGCRVQDDTIRPPWLL